MQHCLSIGQIIFMVCSVSRYGTLSAHHHAPLRTVCYSLHAVKPVFAGKQERRNSYY